MKTSLGRRTDKWVRRVLVLTLCFWAQFAGLSATVYVSVTGNDSAPGSKEQPFGSIGRAIQKLGAGDLVVVEPGVYSERSILTNSVLSGGVLTLRGSGMVTNRGFEIRGKNIVVDGFTMVGACTTAYLGAMHVMSTASNIWLINNRMLDITSYGTVTNKAWSISMTAASKRLDPDGGPFNCIISNNLMRVNRYYMLGLFGRGHVVVSNVFDTVGNDMLRPNGADHVVRGNLFTHIGMDDVSAHPDWLQSVANGFYVTTNILFEANIVENSPEAQICQLEGAFGGVNADIRDWTFRNNIFRNTFKGEVMIPETKWYNNIFYKVSPTVGVVLAVTGGSGGYGHKTDIRNNVFLGCGALDYMGPTKGWYSFVNVTNCVADHNYVANIDFSPKASAPPYDGYHFYEPNGVNGGNPRFANPENGDFRLASQESVLINKGVGVAGFAYDFDGKLRPSGGAWDIGPFEFSFDRSSISPPGNLRVNPESR